MTSKKKINKRLSLVLSIVMILSMLSTISLPVFAEDSQAVNIVNNGDMENQAYWWYNNGETTVTSVSDEKNSGSYSLKVTDRTAAWQGVGQNLNDSQVAIPVAGTKYSAAAWVMFNGDTAPEAVTFKLSVKRNDGTDTKYDNIKTLEVQKGVWTKLGADYTLPADTDVSKEVHLYVETDESTETFIDFYLDDVSFSGQAPVVTESPSPTASTSPSPIPSPSTSPDKVVALTFDDGPSSTLTSLVLDKLEKYNVPATFMMVGKNINDSTKDVIKRVVDSGCEIGNHSWDYSSMDKMTAEEVKKSVDDTTAKIQEYSGKTPLFFRAPNLATSTTMFDAIDLTFISGVLAYDWDGQGTTAEDRAKSVIDGVRDGSIILLHDVQPLPHPTPEALDIIIPTLLSKGYEFVTLSELFDRKGVTLSPTDGKVYTTVTSSAPATGNNKVSNGDMETGSDWWYARGGSVEISTDVKHGGSNSLKATGRTASWNGPAQNLVGNGKGDPEKGKTYKAAAWVMFNGDETVPETVTLKLSVQWNNGEAENSDKYDNISQVSVKKGEWTKLEGDYTINEAAVFDKGIQLYVETTESATPMVDLYIDDVSFIDPEPAVTLGGSDSLYSDFENGETSGWTKRGEETVAIANDTAHNGSYSILASGRTQAWNGPKHTLMGVVNYDKTYSISGYVMYKDGPDTASFSMSIEKTAGETTDYINIGSASAAKGKWVKIEGEYTVPFDTTLSDLALYFETPTELADFYLDDVKVAGGDSLNYDPDITALKSVWDQYFPLGVAVSPTLIESPIYSQYIKKHYSSLTADNCMKPDAIQPTEGQFTFDEADKLVNFAKSNNMLMRGHTLLWHSQIPDWFFTDPADSTKPATSEKLLERLKTHIEAVMTRYNGKIHTYDVVNEVLSDSNGLRGERENSKWKSIVGDVDKDGVDDDYIIKAFEYAYEAANKLGDNNVKFCINDYNLESSTKKVEMMYNTVKRILEKTNIPPQRLVVGFQMHISNYSPSIALIKKSLESFKDLGVKVQVTEMDVSIYRNSSEPKKAATEDMLRLQAERYKDIFALFKEEAQNGIMDSVTIWGGDDGNTWLNDFPVKGRPDPCLLFDKRLQAKTAYTALVNPDSLPVYRQQIAATKGTPVLGNSIDKIWGTIKWADANQFVTGTEGATAKIKTMWDSNYLYVLAQVDDKTSGARDNIEIFLDKNVAATEASPDNVRHYVIYPKYSGSSDLVFYIIPSKDGYIVQAAIPINNISPATGKTLGIDFRINDDKGDGSASSVVVWNDEKNKLDTVTTGFGDVLLDKEAKLIVTDYGTAVVDGRVDSLWNGIKEDTTGVWVSGASGSTASFKTMRDDNNMYVLAVVKDELLSKASANVYEQDSVEIFIDEDNAKNSYYEADDYQIRINYANEVTYDHGVQIEGFTSATAIIEGGYIVEASIPLTTIKPEEGKVIGFDVQVNNDQDGDGTRDSVSMWCDPSGLSYKDLSGLGNVMFGEKRAILIHNVSGYIAPDFLKENSASSELKSGFKVELVGTSKSAVTDENGFFEFKDVTASSSGYCIRISKNGYLTREIQVGPANGDVVIGSASKPTDIWAGDLNNDGCVNLVDIVECAKAFNKVAGDPSYDQLKDCNLDGSINMKDIVIIANNFNTSSKSYPVK